MGILELMMMGVACAVGNYSGDVVPGGSFQEYTVVVEVVIGSRAGSYESLMRFEVFAKSPEQARGRAKEYARQAPSLSGIQGTTIEE